ncbi:MAG: hypothetical protein ACLQIB_17465 [Isosphaeraceae bacterium]
MASKLDPLPDQEKNKLIEDLLREQGLSTIYKLTPFLFMDADERPSVQLLARCQKGITTRNNYMHSLFNYKKGEYKVRSIEERDLFDAYSAVMDVYQCYVNAIDQRTKRRNGALKTDLPHPPTIPGAVDEE